MHGHLSTDVVLEFPAAEVWEIYRGLELAKFVNKHLRDVIGTVEVLQGDGGPGTILKVTFPPGTPAEPGYYKEIYTRVDEEVRFKEAEMIEGRFKDLGFDLYRDSIQILEKDAESCIVRASIEYEIDDKLQEIASDQATTESMETLAQAIGKYLKENRGSI